MSLDHRIPGSEMPLRTAAAMDESWDRHQQDHYGRFLHMSAFAGRIEREITELVAKYTQRGTVFDAVAARLRQAQFVPGKMHCAKCKFALNRVTLYMGNGVVGATPGNEPEACPNGCGPLWPVTWEQEARECWAHIEKLADQLFPPKDSHL